MHVNEIIKGLDTQLFLAINGLHSSYFDNFMWVISAKLIWIPLYLSVLYLLMHIRFERELLRDVNVDLGF